MTETTDPIRVALVDDQELVRHGFRLVLDAQSDMTVVAEAGDGAEALQVLRHIAADVVLMDIRMPRLDGVEATRELARGDAAPKVVVLTTFDLDEYAFAALKAGAAGFLLKDAGPHDLLAAIRAVHAGDSVIAPSTTRRLLDHVLPGLPSDAGEAARVRAEAERRLSPLTAREREVLQAIGEGMNNAEVAAALFLSEATVKTHITRILSKLQLRDRVQMVLLAHETGLSGRRASS